MGYEAKKTEHCGPKRGNGAYWGYKWEAKKESNRIRRENWKREIRAALADSAVTERKFERLSYSDKLAIVGQDPCSLAGYHMERMPHFVSSFMLLLAATAAAQLQDGATLFHSRRYAEAERVLRSRLAAKPADEHARLYLAKTLIELNRLPDAVAEIHHLAGLRSSPEARYQAGLILRQLAERRFQDLEQAAPGSPAVLVLAAQRLERQGNHSEALEHYRAAAKLEPQRPGIHFAIGNALWRTRDLEGAVKELSMELARNPQHGMAGFRLGQVLIARGEEAAAIGPLEAAREALPENLEIQRELGKAYRKAGRDAEARRTWEALARARPGDNQVHFLLGGLYREMGEPALAQAALARHRAILERRRALSEQQRR